MADTTYADRPQDTGREPAVAAELKFAVRTAEKPYAYVTEPPAGVPRTRLSYEMRPARIESARAIAEQARLDVDGFMLVRSPTAVVDFYDEAQTLAVGHPEAAQLVKDVTGASRVVVFDHTRRRANRENPDMTSPALRQPAGHLHVDQTFASGAQRIREIMGPQADALLSKRAAIINVWRPIAYAARDYPLVLGDHRSIAPEDLIATDMFFANRNGENYGIAHNPQQRWLYVPDVQPDEAFLIKCWDSDTSVAPFAPHSAFDDPTTPAGTPPRQSIEFRTIAFFG